MFKATFAFLILGTVLFAATVDGALDSVESHLQKGVKSQQKIDKLDDQTRALYEEYRSVMEEKKRLDAYNAHMKTLVGAQQDEIASLDEQIEGIDHTHQTIIPLMHRMVDTLEEFVALDMPFLVEERTGRIAELKAMMDKASVSIAEKYRKIMEAYSEENAYARTIEAYRAKLGDEGRIVDFLRIGRAALYYQTLDGKEIGLWDKKAQQWRTLDETYRYAIKQGLLMARKQAAPDLLTLPINAPGAAGGEAQ